MRAKVQKHQACNYFLLQLCGERRCQSEVHTGCTVPVKTFYQFAQKHDMACFNRPLLCSVCSSICLVLKKSGRKARLHVSCMHVIIISPLKAQLIKAEQMYVLLPSISV